MSESIKLIYSWIGPKGPMVNTELPNILSFAAVAEGTKTESHNFWADDLWWRVFHKYEPYRLASTYAIDNRDTFIYPYTLTWRIPFSNYFYGTSGLFEFSHTPNHIIHHVRSSNGYFLVDCTAEAWVQDTHLDLMHTYFSHFNHIPMGKIIYMTGCMNAQDVYDRWCEKRKIPNETRERMIMISFPISQSGIASNMWRSTEPTYDTETIPEKVFLCWNRRFRPHRTSLSLALDKLGLVDRSYYSMGVVDPEMVSHYFRHTVDLYAIPGFELTPDGAEHFINKLPLKIDDETNINQMCGDFDSAARPFYQNSLVSIVTETNFQNVELTLTEKSFKPSKEKHPFIIVGVPGALRAMRELGYQTFSEFWDESYDEIQDPKIRMSKIIDVCKDIGSWDSAKILDFKRRVKPILENNFKAVSADTTKLIAGKIQQKIEAWKC
jgi:hypothetical protein